MTTRAPHAILAEALPPPAVPAHDLANSLREGLADTGWPEQSALPAAPITLTRTAWRELFDASILLTALLRRTAWEVAPSWEAGFENCPMPESERQLKGPDPLIDEQFADTIVRPDVIVDAQGPKFLEFNVSGGLGGVLETHSRLGVLRAAHRRSGVEFVSPDPFDVRSAMFRQIALERGLPERVAIVGSSRIAGVEERYFTIERDHLRSSGIDAEFIEAHQIADMWDRPADERFMLGHRNLTNGDWAAAGLAFDDLQHLIDDGCLLVGTQRSCFMHHKGTLARLSEGRPWMSTAERSAVERYVPWTRTLGERRTHRGALEVEIAEHTASHQHELVLKAGWGESGEQVVIGREVTATAWHGMIDAALRTGDWVVQELVEPERCDVTLVVDDEMITTPVAPVLGPLVFGGRPAGVFARFRPDGTAGVVNVRGTNPSADGVAVAI